MSSLKEKKDLKTMIEEEKQKITANNAINGAKEALASVEAETDRLYGEYNKFAEIGDYRQANYTFKMFVFMQKLSNVAAQYVSLLQSQKAIADLIDMIAKTYKTFTSIINKANFKITTKVVKGLKKFRKTMRTISGNMERMTAAMDALFDEKKPKKPKKGKSLPTDEELFNQSLANNQLAIASYAKTHNVQGGIYVADPTNSSSGSLSSGHYGGMTGGVEDPYA